ncbi:MAG TPA: hypothetical protein VHI13_20350 [Candidatus Kapabacteria bacterium]|nr:hypothetical protein [Candidatus Kapabacteria bacterium]
MKQAERYARKRNGAARPLLLLVPMVALAAGCGLFDTRQPENPINAGSTFEQPTTPSVVLRNLESALTSANAGDYRKCFSDTSLGLPPFIFYPSAQGLSAAPSKFVQWGIDQEETYIGNIFAELMKGSVCSVQFSPTDVTDVPIADSLQFSATYSVHFPHTRDNAERDADGTLVFTFRLSKQNEWYISAWRDVAIPNKTSWSLIKARFIDK